MTAPSGMGPLAWRESFRLKRKVCLSGSHPFRLAAARQSTFPKGTAFSGGGKVSGIAIRRPLGGAAERSEAEGVFPVPHGTIHFSAAAVGMRTVYSM